MPVRVAVRVMLCIVAVAWPFTAIAADPHLSTDRARALYNKSAFLHGYMHGYEEGFHCADLDLQMARGFRDVRASRQYKKPSGYHSSFGDKHLFEAGYRKGLFVGYTDGYAGRNFRAVALVRQAAGDLLDKDDPQLKPDKIFDDGLLKGYESGQNRGLQDGRAEVGFRSPAADCDVPIPGSSSRFQGEFCDAFRRGYLIGYSDGYTNQQQTPAYARK